MFAKRSLIFFFAPLALVVALPALASAQGPEHYRAFAVNMSNVGSGGSTTLDIVIERWTSDAEKAKLAAALERGQDALLSALQKVKPRAGYIQVPGSTGWNVGYASKTPGEDGGWQITLLTDRPIGFAEAATQPQTIDYPFTLIEMHVNKDGQGEGKASVLTKIVWDKATRTLELEDYASEPVRLQQISLVK